MPNDQVLVRFGGDTGQFKTQMDGAANTVRGTTQSIRDSLSTLNASMAQLQSQMGALSASSERIAASTKGLLSYENWRFGLAVVSYAYNGVTTAIDSTSRAIDNTKQAIRDHVKDLGYMKEYGNLVKVENTGLAASVGRLVESYDLWIRSAEIYKSGLLQGAGATVAAAGAMERFQQVAQEGGFENATRALQYYTRELTKVPGMTNEVAASIQSGFASIKNLTLPLQETLVNLTVQMSTTKEGAQQLAEKMTAAFRDPASGGMSLLSSLGAVNESLRQQFRLAQQNNDVQGMQSVLVRGLIGQEKLLMQERLRGLQEQLKAYSELGFAGRLMSVAIQGQVRDAERALEVFEKQTRELERAATAIRRMVPAAEELRSAMNGVATGLNPLSTQLDTIASKIGILSRGLQGSTDDAASLIRKFEDFRSDAYWDVNAYRTGYGSDTKTNPDGSVEKVTKDTTVTREDAERDLARRIVEFQQKAAEAIGPAWASLSERAKASITSVTYNYGSTPGSVVRGAQSGNEGQLAEAIRSLSANPGRRSQEANNITSGTLSGASAKEIEAATQAKAKLLDQQRQLNESVQGGSDKEKANLKNIQDEIDGKKDEVLAQQRIVDATKSELDKTQDIQSKQKISQDLRREELVLEQKRGDLKKSQLNLAIAEEEEPAKILKAKMALYAFEQSKVAEGSAQWNQIEAQKIAAQAAFDKTETANAKLMAEEKRNIALKELEERRTILREQVAEGQISHRDLLQADIVLENQRTAIEREYWTSILATAREGTQEYKQVMSSMTQLDAEASARRQKTVSRDMQMIVRDYRQAFDQIGSTISSSLMGMLQGTEKFSNLIRNVALKIVQYFLDAGIKMVTTWAANMAAKAMATTTGEAAETAAVAAGTTARTGMESGAAAASMATKIPAIIKSITSSAAETFAGVFGWLSPIMGPLAAGPAAAAMGTVMGATSMVAADIGMWSVPHDRVALIHENEHIMPAREAEAFRNMLSNGGGGQAPVSATAKINISSPDARGVKRLFESNDRVMVRTLNKAIRRGVHRSGSF